jgi:hypothetical protein
MLDLLERAIAGSVRLGLGMRDSAEGDFFVGSSKTELEKLAKEYDACGGLFPSYPNVSGFSFLLWGLYTFL